MKLGIIEIYRRPGLVGRAGMIMLLFSTVMLVAACDVSWVSQAVNIINVLVPAILGALGLLTAFGAKVPPDIFAAVNKGSQELVNDLQNLVLPLIQQWEKASAEAKPGILSEIEAALRTATANFAGIMAAVHIADPALQAKIQAVMAAIETELLALLNILPVIQGTTTLEAFEAAGNRPPLNAGQFKHHFNEIMGRATGNVEVDAQLGKFKVA